MTGNRKVRLRLMHGSRQTSRILFSSYTSNSSQPSKTNSLSLLLKYGFVSAKRDLISIQYIINFTVRAIKNVTLALKCLCYIFD